MLLVYRLELWLHEDCELGSVELFDFKEYVESVLDPLSLVYEVSIGDCRMEVVFEFMEMNREDVEWELRKRVIEDPYVLRSESKVVVV